MVYQKEEKNNAEEISEIMMTNNSSKLKRDIKPGIKEIKTPPSKITNAHTQAYVLAYCFPTLENQWQRKIQKKLVAGGSAITWKQV